MDYLNSFFFPHPFFLSKLYRLPRSSIYTGLQYGVGGRRIRGLVEDPALWNAAGARSVLNKSIFCEGGEGGKGKVES